MTAGPAAGAPSSAPFDWEGEGARIGESLDARHFVVVIGEDADATARVALGLARAQSGRRRVAVGDLLGEAPPLQSLVEGDDPHGLVDSFLYGVSLNRIARRVPDAGELFILPTGSQPIEYDDMLPNVRWRRLAGGFREVGALLLIAVPASAPGIERLVETADGAILVGDVVPAQLPVSQVIASVRAPAPAPAVAVLPEVEREPEPEELEPRVLLPRLRWWRRVPLPAAAAGIAATLLLAGTGIWLAARPLAESHAPASVKPHERTSSGAMAGSVPDSTLGLDPVARAPDASLAPPISDPGDSAGAAQYSVSWLKLNGEAGALMRLQQDGKDLPAATYTPLLINNSPWYELRVGAYRDSADAEALLATLRGTELLGRDAGAVIRAPLAFVIDSAGSREGARKLLDQYLARQLPVYMLYRATGSGARLYVGAFASPVESSLYAGMLRAAGIAPVLAYRIGRVF